MLFFFFSPSFFLVIYGNDLYIRTKQGTYELDLYLSNKHDELLASTLEPGTFKKRFSLVIVDGFAVEISDAQVMLSIAYVVCTL